MSNNAVYSMNMVGFGGGGGRVEEVPLNVDLYKLEIKIIAIHGLIYFITSTVC